MTYDLFISHASEDKADFVRPLATTLSEFGVKVWYDEFTLELGDSLSRSIDKGLVNSSYGLVILSPTFLEKGWTEYELQGLLAKEIGNKNVIIPVWHNLTKEELLSFSPSLADKIALKSDGLRAVELSVSIIKVVRPDLFEKIQRRAAYLSAKGESKRVETEKIRFAPPRHEELPINLISRVRLIRAALLGVYPHSMQFWIDGFRGDAHPSREIRIWEHVASCYIEYCAMTRLTEEQQQKVFAVISAISCGLSLSEASEKAIGLPEDAIEKIGQLWEYPVPIYDFEDSDFPLDYEASSEDLERMQSGDAETFPHDVPDELIRELISDEDDDKA